MKSVNVTIRVNEDVKREADALFADLGMSLSTAFNIFLRQALREQGLPFAVSRQTPNAVTLAAMDAAEQGVDLAGPFDSVDALMDSLDA